MLVGRDFFYRREKVLLINSVIGFGGLWLFFMDTELKAWLLKTANPESKWSTLQSTNL